VEAATLRLDLAARAAHVRVGRWAAFSVAMSLITIKLLSGYRDVIAERSPYALGLLAIPLAAVVAGVNTRYWHEPELDVHDRTVDMTVAAAAALLAVGLSRLFQPRLDDLAFVLRIDLAGLALWTFAIATALFGLRPTWRHRRIVGLLLVLWPLPLDMVAIAAPPDGLGPLVLAWLACICLVALMRARPFVILLAFGLGVDAAVHTCRYLPHGWRVLAVVIGPATTIAAAALMRVQTVGRSRVASRRATPVPRSIRPHEFVFVAIAVAGAVLLTPGVEAHAMARGALLPSGVCPVIPGHLSIGQERVGRTSSYGSVASTRCRYRTTAEVPVRFVVDISDPAGPNELSRFPFDATYWAIGSRGPMQPLHLGGTTPAQMFAYRDAALPLTTVVVTWDRVARRADDGAQRIAVIVNDDPRPTSPFPRPGRRVAKSLMDRMLEVIRTNPHSLVNLATSSQNEDIALQVATAVAAWPGAAR
jgi:hypothetical protein